MVKSDISLAKKGIGFAFFSCILFVIFTLIAMFSYPGGTYNDPHTTGYSFWENFFSDLGRMTTFLGEPKTVSLVFFVISLVLVGFAFISFSLLMPGIMHSFEKSRVFVKIGSVFGFIAGVGFIGVALTPWELLLIPHIISVYIAFLSFLLVVIFYSIGIFRDENYHNIYAYLFMLFAVFLAAYILLLFLGPSVEDKAGLIINAAGQKIIVYLAIIIMFVQSLGALKYIKDNLE